MKRVRGAVRARQWRGAVTIEFLVLAPLVFLPLLMAVMQMGMLMLAKNTVNLAALNAARAGAASGGDRGAMNLAYATALAPLYLPQTLGGSLTDLSNLSYATVLANSMLRARAEIAAGLSSVRPLNPTAGSFTDFGVMRNGVRVIPVTGLETNNAVGARSRQRRSDALLLKVQVRHCYPLAFPFIDRLVINVLRGSNLNAADQICYARNGVPIAAQSVVRMTVPPVATNFR